MIFLETRLYLIYRAKRLKIKWHNSYLSSLDQYKYLIEPYGCRLDFHWWRCFSFKILNCNAGFGKHTPIVASPCWVEKLIFNNSEATQNAFLMSLGHELTHKENDISIFKGVFIKNGIRFIAHTNEVHADFGAVQKLANNNRKKQIEAMNYKMSHKKNTDISDFFHPSWNKRQCYVKKYNFNEELIKQIAQDDNCTNQKLICNVVGHFEEIYLI